MKKSDLTGFGLPEKQGLYDPAFEKDACGVGFICNLDGEQTHAIVSDALQILINLTHRGAVGGDNSTGDGAGILMQIPHEFFKNVSQDAGVKLPELTEYGTGLVFLPRDKQERETCMRAFESVVKTEGQVFLGWRDVPVENEILGAIARAQRPRIGQIFIGRGREIKDQEQFERKLYVIRKVIENEVREMDLAQKKAFSVPSLSSKTFVYKGLLLAEQMAPFYQDLRDESMKSALAVVHQRYSTNTFPTWDLAQPFRYLCHNGEINTLRGNENWMNARERLFKSDLFGRDIRKLFPICTPGASDSAVLDNALELLYHTGRPLAHCMMMLIPEAWQNHETMSDEKKAFYEYHASFMEPWDGPASIPFTDGKVIGAMLDRNGLRPSRYTVTKSGQVIMGSETGVLEIAPENIAYKGRLEPGKMFVVDMEKSRIIEDEEIKHEITSSQPYRKWLRENLVDFNDLPHPKYVPGTDFETLTKRQQLFGYSIEDLNIILTPMIESGKEAIGSMGDDTPLAVLSNKSCLLYDYFKQLFAQVTNPPLDAIREKLVTSLGTALGAEQNLFDETPKHCHQFKLDQPVLTNEHLEQIRHMYVGDIRSITLPILYKIKEGGEGLRKAMDALCKAASEAVDDGYGVIILSDRNANNNYAPIPAALATAGVHHRLIKEGQRTECGLVVESGEPREVHHFAVLIGYGASAVNPYLVYETIDSMIKSGMLSVPDLDTGIENYIEAMGTGLLKVMSKMGISTLQSYQGAQIFEAVGLNEEVINKYFTGTPSRIGGIGLDGIYAESKVRYDRAYPKKVISKNLDLEMGGKYQWRRDGEHHQFNPFTISKLQTSVRQNDPKTYQEYADLVNKQNTVLGTLRGLLEFKTDKKPISIEEVEPWTEIVKRFKTGAMSYGSISKESHETMAIAMNRLGGKSNSGEGGEDADRYLVDENGDTRRSAIKQVASGRFGVTSHYLVNADEIQIKMAQGAKPGEGGQLPGFKVYPWIAKTRHSTPYVGLISPPPHHDIYSIEDLAQLIHDLKNANTEARINVKLVSEIGVGTVAAGVSKGKADVVLISGGDGGTGASPLTSLKHAGLPWELGLAETHQTLVMNDLRSRIVVECDGQMKTGRDVAIACLLGAEEFGFASAPLVAVGCIMMRVCHLNTCPVGIATQDPELRAKFAGQPEHVVNYFNFVAEELRIIMAALGFRTINEMVGQVDRLEARNAVEHWKAKGLDYSRILYKPKVNESVGVYCSQKQDHGLAAALDYELLKNAKPALENAEEVEFELEIKNINRTVGTILSSEISRKYGADGLPDDTIKINCHGSAGQSFCAFGAKGVTFRIHGDANDYFGKGLSGAKLIIAPPEKADIVAEENVLIGNVAFYGATSGQAYIRGLAGERFCVRNSGVRAVVEGVGDHGCEYMTGGRAVILGATGRNFAAGMSGGIAYVLDEKGDFAKYLCNREMVDLEAVTEAADLLELKTLIMNQLGYTGSAVAKRILDDWDNMLKKFIKIMPVDYKRALEMLAAEKNSSSENGVIDEPEMIEVGG